MRRAESEPAVALERSQDSGGLVLAQSRGALLATAVALLVTAAWQYRWLRLLAAVVAVGVGLLVYWGGILGLLALTVALWQQVRAKG